MAFFRGHSAVVALVVLAPSCAEAFGSTPDRESRTPFAFDVSGGGFRTMTVGMGFARALSEAFDEVGGGWADITHLSGNSGGNWFATQFAFGKEFYTELTQRHMVLGYKSMPAILADWANGYSENIEAIQDIPFEPNVCIVDIGFVQLNVTNLVEGFVQALTFFNFPAIDWELYTSAMVKATLPSIDTLTYDEPRPGLPDAALLQMLTMPPSVWTNASYPVFRPASFNSDGAAMNLPLYHRIPAASSALAETPTGFVFPTAGGANAELSFRPGYGPDFANGPAVDLEFIPPAQTRVAEVMAISSAAPGLFASPTTVQVLVREAVPNITDAGLQAVLECLPLGLQSLAPPLTMQVVQDPPGEAEPPWTPTYRGFDGGYTDNTAMVGAIAGMIADCEAGDSSLRCNSKTFDMVVVDDGAGEVGLTIRDRGCFFNKTGCAPVGTDFLRFGVLVPSQRVFLEDYPSGDQWIQYTPRLSSAPEDDPPLFNFAGLPEDVRAAVMEAQAGFNGSGAPDTRPPLINATPTQFGLLLGQSIGIFSTTFVGSRVTAGTFNTIDNDAWNIKAGYRVNLLLFEVNHPLAFDPVFWPANFAVLAFLTMYAPIVEAQRKGALPYLKQWLVNRTISPI